MYKSFSEQLFCIGRRLIRIKIFGEKFSWAADVFEWWRRPEISARIFTSKRFSTEGRFFLVLEYSLSWKYIHLYVQYSYQPFIENNQQSWNLFHPNSEFVNRVLIDTTIYIIGLLSINDFKKSINYDRNKTELIFFNLESPKN